MTDSTIQVPHLAWPLQIGPGGTFLTVEQDGDDDVMQSVLVLVSTPQGRQIELPEYGVEEQIFKTPRNIDLDAIAQAVADWEPRASIDASVQVDSIDELIDYVQIGVTD